VGAWRSEAFFQGDNSVFFQWVTKRFLSSGETSLYQLQTKKKNYRKKLWENIILQNSGGKPRHPCHPFRRPCHNKCLLFVILFQNCCFSNKSNKYDFHAHVTAHVSYGKVITFHWFRISLRIVKTMSGVNPSSKFGAAISIIFGSQFSLQVHYCKRGEIYFTTLLWLSNGRKIALYHKCCLLTCTF